MSAALALTPKVASRLFLGVERSVCGRPWRDRLDERATTRALAIAQRHNVPELLARILAGRGVEVDEVEAFLDPTVRRLMPDPHTVTAMEAAAMRLADAMTRGEQVAIFGDYDVDGATASALLARFLRLGGSEPIVHIPDRIFEGYGPNVEAIRALADRGAKLLVTVDCGTASIEPLAEARRLGLDVIVIDHHQADERLPDAIVVNANRLDDLSGLGHLAAFGLVYKVHLHREVLALHGVLALIVEVVLHQFVAVVADGQRVAAFVVDLDSVAVVDAISDVFVVGDSQGPRHQIGLQLESLGTGDRLGKIYG